LGKYREHIEMGHQFMVTLMAFAGITNG